MPTYWKAVTGFGILRKTWDRESVIYHTGSGDTQLLDTVGITILDYVQSKAVSSNDILEYIKTELAVDIDKSVLLSLLNELSRSGVISRFQA